MLQKRTFLQFEYAFDPLGFGFTRFETAFGNTTVVTVVNALK
jgi:hypothetical protein